jgi:hypothetical protein
MTDDYDDEYDEDYEEEDKVEDDVFFEDVEEPIYYDDSNDIFGKKIRVNSKVKIVGKCEKTENYFGLSSFAKKMIKEDKIHKVEYVDNHRIYFEDQTWHSKDLMIIESKNTEEKLVPTSIFDPKDLVFD